MCGPIESVNWERDSAGGGQGGELAGRSAERERDREHASSPLDPLPWRVSCSLTHPIHSNPHSQRVLSGVQPTGGIHLGNYLGAVRQWVGLQTDHDAFYCVVDLHAVTLPHSPSDLLAATRSNAAIYLAAGVDPSRSAVFAQSHVPAHTELAWLLTCYTPLGWLRRMVQYKDKVAKQGGGGEMGPASSDSEGGGPPPSADESVGAGLLTYPVLMAADILAYRADLVPVGEDQKQHIELARDLADRFNSKFGGRAWKKMGGRGGRLFVPPEPITPTGGGARVMSLTDGTSKMSKSAPSDASRINLLDAPDVIASKIKRAKTDASAGITGLDASRPEARNLVSIYAAVTDRTVADVEAEVAALTWGEFKPRLADAVVEHLRPLQTRHAAIMADIGALDAFLADGADRASAVASGTLDDVRQAMGFVPPARRGGVVGGVKAGAREL